MSETNELLRELIAEIKGLRQTNESIGEDSKQQNEKLSQSNFIKAAGSVASAAQSTLGKFAEGSSVAAGGDLRGIGSFGLSSLGSVFGPKGAAIGNAAGNAASAISTLVSPRGYNYFNLFEEFDRTVTSPYKRLEDLAAQYARAGVDIPVDRLRQIYEMDKKRSRMEQGGRDVVRQYFSDETSGGRYLKNTYVDKVWDQAINNTSAFLSSWMPGGSSGFDAVSKFSDVITLNNFFGLFGPEKARKKSTDMSQMVIKNNSFGEED